MATADAIAITPAWLTAQRWFRAKSRAIRGTAMVDELPLSATARLVVVEAAYADGGPADRYLVPLGGRALNRPTAAARGARSSAPWRTVRRSTAGTVACAAARRRRWRSCCPRRTRRSTRSSSAGSASSRATRASSSGSGSSSSCSGCSSRAATPTSRSAPSSPRAASTGRPPWPARRRTFPPAARRATSPSSRPSCRHGATAGARCSGCWRMTRPRESRRPARSAS